MIFERSFIQFKEVFLVKQFSIHICIILSEGVFLNCYIAVFNNDVGGFLWGKGNLRETILIIVKNKILQQTEGISQARRMLLSRSIALASTMLFLIGTDHGKVRLFHFI